MKADPEGGRERGITTEKDIGREDTGRAMVAGRAVMVAGRAAERAIETTETEIGPAFISRMRKKRTRLTTKLRFVPSSAK